MCRVFAQRSQQSHSGQTAVTAAGDTHTTCVTAQRVSGETGVGLGGAAAASGKKAKTTRSVRTCTSKCALRNGPSSALAAAAGAMSGAPFPTTLCPRGQLLDLVTNRGMAWLHPGELTGLLITVCVFACLVFFPLKRPGESVVRAEQTEQQQLVAVRATIEQARRVLATQRLRGEELRRIRATTFASPAAMLALPPAIALLVQFEDGGSDGVGQRLVQQFGDVDMFGR